MTQEERENLISGFLSANAGNTDVNTTRMLNMLVESLAYSKLQELLPEVQKQSAPSQIQKEGKMKKVYRFLQVLSYQPIVKNDRCDPLRNRKMILDIM